MLLDILHQQPERHNVTAFMDRLAALGQQFGELLLTRNIVDNNSALELGPNKAEAVISQSYPKNVAANSGALVGQIAKLELHAIGLEADRQTLSHDYFGAQVSVSVTDPDLDLDNYQPHSYNPGETINLVREQRRDQSQVKGIITDILADGSFVLEPFSTLRLHHIPEQPYRIQPFDAQGQPQVAISFI